MQGLLVTILLGWMAVATIVSCEQASDKPQPVDLEGLNLYLVQNLAKNDNLQANLEHIKSHSAEMAPGVREAGKLLVDLVETSDVCSKEVMAAVVELDGANMHWNGHKRVEKLASVAWKAALQTCEAYIMQAYQKVPLEKTNFFEAFNPHINPFAQGIHFHRFEDINLYTKMSHLARKSPHGPQPLFQEYDEVTGKLISRRKDRATFDHAFDQLLVKQCYNIMSNENILDNMAAITLLEYNRRSNTLTLGEFYIGHSIGIMSWTRRICNRVINLNEDERTRIYGSVRF